MSLPAASPHPLPAGLARALANHADDELLRVPPLWERLIDAVLHDRSRPKATASPTVRMAHDDARRLAQEHHGRMRAAYLGALREAVQHRLAPPPAARPAARTRTRVQLELVSDDVIALDVELSHTVQAIKDAAEQPLTDLQGYLAALVGDHLVSEDHNPLPPAAHAQALRAAAQALPGALAERLAFIRAATPTLAELLQESYAAACERLAAQGLEPAEHRSVVSQQDHRWRFMPAPITLPDLLGMRDAMPRDLPTFARHRAPAGAFRAPPAGAAEGATAGAFGGAMASAAGASGAAGATGAAGAAVGAAAWAEELRACGHLELQALELVSRLFKAMVLDERVPDDVGALLGRLREPAMRLALRDASLLDRLEHPLWRWIHLFAYQAEMVPRVHDAERRRWLEFGRRTIEQLAAAPLQRGRAYRDAVVRLEAFLGDRLAKRVAALARRLDALQRTEAGLAVRAADGEGDGDGPELDTVPAALLPNTTSASSASSATAAAAGDEAARQAAVRWAEGLVPGQWLRLLLDGAWVHAQLLWLGDRRQILLLGDADSKTTWAVRRPLLLKMHRHGLAKTLRMRSLVGTAALRVQEQLALAAAA